MGVFMKDDRKEQGKCFIRDGMEDLRDVVHGNRSPFRDFRAEHEEGTRCEGALSRRPMWPSYRSPCLVHLSETSTFHLYQKEGPVECTVLSEGGRSGQRGQVLLARQIIAECVPGRRAFLDRVDHEFRRIISLHGEECWHALEALLIALDKILNAGVRAFGEKPVDEDGTVNGLIRCSGKIRGVPTVAPKKRDLHVVKV